MTLAEVLDWLAGHVGRTVRLVVYSDGLPLATLEGPLGEGVLQDPSVFGPGEEPRPVVAFAIGAATVGLDEQRFLAAERVGRSLTVRLRGGVELVAFPLGDPAA